MEHLTILPYEKKYYTLWNDFVKTANNTTFLFHRDYLEYHQDRFEDVSLMIFEGETLIAVIPAHQKERQFYSHWGLTFGGIIVNNFNFNFIKIIHTVSDWLKHQGFSHWHIKPILKFYSSENKDFDWHSAGFNISSIDENLVLDYSDFKIHKTKLKHYRNHLKLAYEIKEEPPNTFWNEILVPLLKEKYHTSPVHSLEEITLLQSLFPKHIRHFSLYYRDRIQAGITIFENKWVVKSQYGCVSEEGKTIRALDSLFIYLIDYYQSMGKTYFDMGTVMDDTFPNRINVGLKNQKLELGCKVDILTKYTKIL